MRTTLFVIDNKFPGDIRVDKEVEAIRDVCKVIVVCREKGNVDLFANVEIIQIPLIKFKFFREVFDSINALLWIHLPLLLVLLKVRFRKEIEIVHIHDLPLCFTVFILMSQKIKIIDFHENYPEAIEAWFEHRKNLIIRIKNKLLFGFSRWKNYEISMISKSDWIITVVDEMTEKFKSEGVPDSKVLTIGNYESKKFLKYNTKKLFIDDLSFIRNSLFYIGNFGPHRGLDTVIKSLWHLRQSGLNINFIVAGVPNNNDTREWLESLIAELKLQNKVKFIGRVPSGSYNFLLSNAYINIIPHKSNRHTENTVPHKLFQCFFCRKPLIVSSCAPLKRYVQQLDAGAVFEADDAKDLALTIEKVVKNYELYCAKSEKAFEYCYKSDLNWDSEGKRLADFYKNL